MKRIALAVLGLQLLATAALAQSNFAMPPPAGVVVGGYQVVSSCGAGSLSTTQPAFGTVDTTGKLCTAATVTATVTGFTPNLNFATLTATGSSASVALPTGAVVYFQNTGTTAVSCTLGIGSATATTNEIIVQPSSGVPAVVGSNTFGACIDQTGSASNLVVLAGGSGLANAFGGGGGSGTNASVGATGSAVPASATYVGMLVGGNLTGIPGTANGQLVDTNTSSQIHADIIAPPTLGSASAGWTPKLLNSLSTPITSIKSSAAGQLGLLHCGNSAASGSAFIQVFDVATAGGVTLGVTTPKLSFEITAGSSSGYTLPLVGIQFANGIQVAATTTPIGIVAPSTLPNCNAAFN